VVYKYAQNNLTKETLEKKDLECKRLEQEAKSENLQGKYLALIAGLKQGYRREYPSK